MFNAVIRRRQSTRHPQTWSTAETFFLAHFCTHRQCTIRCEECYGRNSEHPDCLPWRSPAWPLWTELSPIPKSRPPDIAKNPQSPQATSRFHILVFHAISVPHTSGRLPYTSGPSMSAVPAHPRGFPHMLAPFSHAFPRLPQSPHADADPHSFSWLPIRFRGSPIQPPSSKNLTLVLTRPAFGSLKPTHPIGLRGFHNPTMWGDPASATAMRRRQRGLPVIVRLEARQVTLFNL